MYIPPRQSIAILPTPIEEFPRLTQFLHAPHLLVKRDDLTGLGFGGNKTRKLEFLIADALAMDSRMLITAGAIQSNHCRQTAAAAARFGLDCVLILTGDSPQQLSGNLLLDHLFGAEIIWTSRTQRDEVLESTFTQARENGKRPYLVPYGGSNPTGACAYAFAIQELLSQTSSVDWIVFASSSGGTQAGMVVGANLFGYSGHILGISVDEPHTILQNRIAELASGTADFLGKRILFSASDILVNDEYLGEGYGILGDPEREAIRIFAQQAGILLDPVYTSRAAAGLINLIRQGYFPSGGTILFWHTGGTPALFADRYKELGVL